jgi:transposase InsO family protein
LRAQHGEKRHIVAALAEELGVSKQTAYARLKTVLPTRPRKRRRDAGTSALSLYEAMTIATYIEETLRETAIGAATVERALEVLRANGKVLAGRIDEATGEFLPLSASQVLRQMRKHNCHPSMLRVDPAAVRLSSPHPNWCWQIDASVSRQYYLSADGTRIMDRRTYYRGKPANFVAIESQRIWRYAVTDHASGTIELCYVQGAESAANFLTALIHAMVERPIGTMHGVPRYLMSDPGSAVTAQATRNLCAALGIELIVNSPGNARAKGQVENAHWLIETGFESGFKMQRPYTSIAEINADAQLWARDFNATRVHSRHGETRRAAWNRITTEQLWRVTCGVEGLRRLANKDPKTCTVRDGFIKFGGHLYQVIDLPGGVANGQKLKVVVNGLADAGESVRVLCKDANGLIYHYLAPRVTHKAFGFVSTAAEIGTEYRALPDSPVDVARKELERLAMASETLEEARAKRKAKALPFAGEVDPMRPVRERDIPQMLPRQGREVEVSVPELVEPQPAVPAIRPQYVPTPLSHAEMARGLKRRVEERGGTWGADLYARMAETWPAGVPEEDLDACAVQLLRGGLRAVAGGAA